MSKETEIKPRENTDKCTGYRESNCCGARIIMGDICSDSGCKEHCDTACSDCDDVCEDFITFEI